jgi:hypothetical protein
MKEQTMLRRLEEARIFFGQFGSEWKILENALKLPGTGRIERRRRKRHKALKIWRLRKLYGQMYNNRQTPKRPKTGPKWSKIEQPSPRFSAATPKAKWKKIGRRPPPAAQNPKCPQCHSDAENQAYGRSWVAQAGPDAPDRRPRRQTHFSHSPGKKS